MLFVMLCRSSSRFGPEKEGNAFVSRWASRKAGAVGCRISALRLLVLWEEQQRSGCKSRFAGRQGRLPLRNKGVLFPGKKSFFR